MTDPIRTIAILRGVDPDVAVTTARASWDAGIDLIEVPVQGERGLAALRAVVEISEGRIVAAGTVTGAALAQASVDAGAAILIGPNLNAEVMVFAAAHRIPALPGIMTPSELAAAEALGATAVKVFPARVVGTQHFAALRPVFPGMQLVATGGVDVGNVLDFVAAGASAVAFGSSIDGLLAKPDVLRAVQEQITDPWHPGAPTVA